MCQGVYVSLGIVLRPTGAAEDLVGGARFNEFFLFSSQAMAALSAGWVVYSFGWELLLIITIPFILLQLGVIWFWRKPANN